MPPATVIVPVVVLGPVKLVVPYPAGGAADLPARIVSEGLQRKLGKPFIIENKSGAAGANGGGKQ